MSVSDYLSHEQAPRCDDIPGLEESTGQLHNGAPTGGNRVRPDLIASIRRGRFPFGFVYLNMFNFSANHLILLHRQEGRNGQYSVLVMRDDSTRRVYRLHDFSQASRSVLPGHYYCVAGKVNSADRLYLVIESVKPDTKHSTHLSLDGSIDDAEGSSL